MIKRRILLIISLLGVSFGAVFVFYFYQVFFWDNTRFEEDKIAVYLPTGSDSAEVMKRLDPYLKSIDNFRLAAQKKGYFQKIRAGKFTIPKGLNNNDLINILRSGGEEIRVTFNNAERLENLAGKIARQIEADSLSLIKVFQDSEFLSQAGFNSETALAMYLPNSYSLFWNTSAVEFRDRMQLEYKRFWNESRQEKAKAIGLSPVEVSALAAIVQRETLQTDERPRVAGVYLNRLQKRMRLQADPTVIFALKRKYNNYDTIVRRVLYKDLKIDSPYNTYRNRGLPPGPIWMPDLGAIEAVLNAEKHAFLYFVVDLSRPGYHAFARNLREHNRNKRNYVRWLNKKGIRR